VVTSCSYMGHCTALKIFREPYKNGPTPEQLSEVYDTNVRVLEYLGPLQGKIEYHMFIYYGQYAFFGQADRYGCPLFSARLHAGPAKI
jgi:hypothetical protein